MLFLANSDATVWMLPKSRLTTPGSAFPNLLLSSWCVLLLLWLQGSTCCAFTDIILHGLKGTVVIWVTFVLPSCWTGKSSFSQKKEKLSPHNHCSLDICSCGNLYEPWRCFCVKTPVDQQFLELPGQINSLKTPFLHILMLVWTRASRLNLVYMPQCLGFWPCDWLIGYLCKPELEDM